MNGKQFLLTARFLLMQHEGINEAAYRSSISRAYYACFIVIRDLAFSVCDPAIRQRWKYRQEHDINHDALGKYFNNSSSEAVKELGKDLRDLKGSRVSADYHMKEEISVDDARDAIANAEALFETLALIPHVEIKKAVEDYIQITNPIL